MEDFICSGCPLGKWCRSEEYQCVPDDFEIDIDDTGDDFNDEYELTPEIQKLVEESRNRTGWIF